MALIDKIPEIIKHIEANSKFLEYNEKVFNVLEGDLTTEAERVLRTQLISDRAYEASRQRLAPINVLARMTNKLTQIYSSTVERKASDEKYQPVVDFYTKEFDLNLKFQQANLFYNSTKAASLEPFEHEGSPYLRVVPAHQFIMYSDDQVFPNRPTEYIKFMGTIKKEINQGSINRSTKEVPLFFIYSEDEFLAIDKDGEVYFEYMAENQGVNPYGVIPSCYINKSDFLLVPKADEDLLRMTILIVLLFTDMNYACKYQAHSILYGIDVNIGNFEFNPDSFVDLKSEDGKTPKLDTIKPEVDIEQTINLIVTQLDAWFETKNIKAGAAGKITSQNFSSGISLLMKEMDTTLNLKDQIIAFTKFEDYFWEMMIPIHNYWVKNGIVTGLPILGDDFEVGVCFELPKPAEDEDKKLDRVLKGLGKVMTLEQGLKLLYPKLSDDQIEELEMELMTPETVLTEQSEMPVQGMIQSEQADQGTQNSEV